METLFRRYVSAKKWVNPGFMHGPWLPIYGSGVLIMFAIIMIIGSFLPESVNLFNPNGDMYGRVESGPTAYDLIPISVMGICLILLEFISGIIFVRGFKVRLWDYTNMRGNILGVVCPVFSIIWIAVAVIYYYLLNPSVYKAFSNTFIYIFEDKNGEAVNFIFIFLLGIVFGIFILDLIKSLNIFSKIQKSLRKSEGLKKYEEIRDDYRKKMALNKARLIELIPDALKNTLSTVKDKATNNKTNISKKLDELIYIDPSKKTNDNYDESGRPKKEDD